MRHGKYDDENLSTTIQPRMRSGEDWREKRECWGMDPDIFFPEDAEDEIEREARTIQAKSTCARCLVSAMCLDAALRNGDSVGIFGGLDHEERKPLEKGYASRPQMERVHTA